MANRRETTTSTVAFLLLLAALVACGEPAVVDEVTDEAADCGNPMEWDSDGDGVSDGVEATNSDRFAAGRCDENPSIPRGTYHSGSLSGGVNLPDRGAGYEHRASNASAPDEGDWGSLDLLACVETVGREIRNKATIRLGDLSKRPGGEFTPHVSHQNGLEIEVRYPRNDGVDEVVDIRRQPESYSPERTEAVFKAFLSLCKVEAILADDKTFVKLPIGEGDLERVVSQPSRRTHFLVRLAKPTGRGESS